MLDAAPVDEREARLLACLETLEAIVEDRGLLAGLEDGARERLVIAAGRVSCPDRHDLRKLRKARRRLEKEAARAEDERVLEQTGIRALRRAPVFETPRGLPPGTPPPLPDPASSAQAERVLTGARKCYVCKTSFREVHAFYDQMCEPCATLNWERRNASADLSGRVALITGARVKIGYHAAIKLLRAGAHVIVTTRFPRDAAARYAREEDFSEWSERLEVHGLDLRHTPSVELFCQHMLRSHARLDFILNNACQTVRRPSGFYRHLMEGEGGEVPAPARRLLESHEALEGTRRDALARSSVAGSAALSQLPLLPEDRGQDLRLFPEGALDADLQQVDLRGINSWRLTLSEVSAVELLEVHLVNAVAPFVINARLRALMTRTPERDKHIVNVSAMEGQFYRSWKTDRHPHTNMAKAALNMMTRTSAADYVTDGIHMNSVDTGWITDEDPAEIAARKVEEHGFHPPLDVVDGAARIVDPIFHGMKSGEHVWGLFLKDYRPIPW